MWECIGKLEHINSAPPCVCEAAHASAAKRDGKAERRISTWWGKLALAWKLISDREAESGERFATVLLARANIQLVAPVPARSSLDARAWYSAPNPPDAPRPTRPGPSFFLGCWLDSGILRFRTAGSSLAGFSLNFSGISRVFADFLRRVAGASF